MGKTYKRRKRNTKKKQMKSGKHNSKHTLRKMKRKRRVTKRRQRGGMHGEAAAEELGLLQTPPGRNRHTTHKAITKSAEYENFTPLMKAVINGQNDLVQSRLEEGADPNYVVEGTFDRNALILAAKKNNLDVMETLLNSSKYGNYIINPDKVNKIKETPLMITVVNNNSKKHEKIINLLLVRGARVDLVDIEGETALMMAVINGTVSVVKLLLDKEAAVDLADNEGETALMKAVRIGNVSVVKLLLDKGADVDLVDIDEKNPMTALIMAEIIGDVSVVKLLLHHVGKLFLDNKADIEKLNQVVDTRLENVIIRDKTGYNVNPLLNDVKKILNRVGKLETRKTVYNLMKKLAIQLAIKHNKSEVMKELLTNYTPPPI